MEANEKNLKMNIIQKQNKINTLESCMYKGYGILA